jgi:uncharacterized delta-60 repeat protein
MAAGFLDTAFSGDGRLVRSAATAGAVVVQSDGKIVTAGAIDTGGGGSDFLITRYNADGSPDVSFGEGGTVRADFGGRSDIARAVTLQEDGKIVVAGSSGREFAVARFHANGSPDLAFDGDGVATTAFGVSAAALDVVVQADGGIVAAGSASPLPGEGSFALARYNPDGSLDTSFDGDGRVTTGFGLTAAYAVALAPDGKIVAGGTADTHLGDSALVRYNANGSLDASFGPWPEVDDDLPPPGVVRSAFEGYDVYDEIRDVAVDADGTIVAAGHVDGLGLHLARFAPDGLSYETFEAPDFPAGPGGGPVGAKSAATAVVVRSEWVLAAGYTQDDAGRPENFALVRYSPAGVVDRLFGFRGVAVTDFRQAPPGAAVPADPQDAASAMVLAPGGAIVVAGASNGRGAVARFLGAGDATPSPVQVFADSVAIEGTAGGDDARVYSLSGDVPTTIADLNGALLAVPRGLSRIRVNGHGGNDALSGAGAAAAVSLDLDGGTGHDTLVGGAGADTLRGGEGNDRLDGGQGRDSLGGGAGSDTADYASRTVNLDLTLDGVANDGAAGESDNLAADVETVLGGSGNDRIVGSAGNNALYGNGGNDTLDGGRGADLVMGGAGDDLLLATEAGATGAIGSDYYSGGVGFDTLDYSGRTSRVIVRLGRFTLSGAGGGERDIIRDVEGAVGGAGDDVIDGTAGANRLVGGAGADVLRGAQGNDTLLGGAGNDVLTDTSGVNSLDGGDGVDTINGVRDPSGPVVLEAETATVVGARVSASNRGYTGTGFVDYGAASGEYVEWAFDNAAGAGQRTLTFRYANGSSTDRPLELRINGAVVQSRLSFPPTGGWESWRTVTVTVQLAAGTNRIRLTSVGSSGGNLDSLTIT